MNYMLQTSKTNPFDSCGRLQSENNEETFLCKAAEPSTNGRNADKCSNYPGGCRAVGRRPCWLGGSPLSDTWAAILFEVIDYDFMILMDEEKTKQNRAQGV